MKTKYKHIYFLGMGEAHKHLTWACYNNGGGDSIGMVEWYPKWRQYCFCPEPQTVFSASCLIDINDFITQAKGLKKY